MKTLIAIDPGVKTLGWATFTGDVLLTCGLSRATSPQGHAAELIKANRVTGPDRLILEQMTERDIPNAKALLRVTETGAYVAGVMRPVELEIVAVSVWKGNVPKEIHHRRIRAKLTGVETVRLNAALVGVPKSLQHNVVDAVGLGLYGCGRRA